MFADVADKVPAGTPCVRGGLWIQLRACGGILQERLDA